MTNELTTFSNEQIQLIKTTVCPPDTTDNELKLFLHVAKTSGLDPLRKQIHCTKRQGRLTIIAGIDGLQARAAREPDFEGMLHGVVCEKDTFVYDAATGVVQQHVYSAFGDRGKVLGAWATVKRRGRVPFTAIVRFEEFAQLQSPTWKQMPQVMIDKVAKSTALRTAYPEEFSSIYEPAEMDQADAPTGAATAALKEKVLNAAPKPESEQTKALKEKLAAAIGFKEITLTPFDKIKELGEANNTRGPEMAELVKRVVGKKTAKEYTPEDVKKVAEFFSAERVTHDGEPPESVKLPTGKEPNAGLAPF